MPLKLKERNINVSSSSYSYIVVIYFRVGSLLNLTTGADFFSTASGILWISDVRFSNVKIVIQYIYESHLHNKLIFLTSLMLRYLGKTAHEFSTMVGCHM